jgi:hypothetical protein
VRPESVVFKAPPFNQYLSFFQGIEDLTIQQFIPELTIKALIATVLPRTAWFNIERLDPDPF